MLLCQQTHKTHFNYHLVAVELPFIPKVIACMHQTIKTYIETSAQHPALFVTGMLYVYQVCQGVGRCVKDESLLLFFVKPGVKVRWTVFIGYLAISSNVRHYQTHHR